MYNLFLHFPSSTIPIFLPIYSSLYWTFTGNIFFAYLAGCTFIFGEILNRYLKLFFSILFENNNWALRPNPNSYCSNFLFSFPESEFNFGFPSGHCQNIGVFSGLIICYFLNNTDNGIKSLSILLFSFYVGWSRIHLECHNLVQVIFGTIIGFFLGVKLWNFYVFLNNSFSKKNL